MQIDILTIFPEMFEGVFASSIIKRALEKGKVKIVLHNIRNSAADAHKTVDDAPYGGGAGMVMKPDVLAAAVSAVEKAGEKRLCVLLSAQGERFTQSAAAGLALLDQLILICGRYEGVDERFIESFVEREISVGDYIASGGEIPAMAVTDAVIRLIPGVLGNDESVKSESFTNGLLEYPQYTRPPEFNGKRVPEVLLSGNHEEIEAWRHKMSLERTAERRPDLLKK
jgi:tRNA (guanine37-N1)-methyltransferase